jgi:hypothetical protein
MANYNFSPTSRYYETPTKTLALDDGTNLIYLSRRFVPQSSRFALLTTHRVVGGERMDIIAGAELGDAQAFWRICDANDAMRPDDLTARIGRRLRITLPEGIPAAPLV